MSTYTINISCPELAISRTLYTKNSTKDLTAYITYLINIMEQAAKSNTLISMITRLEEILSTLMV